MIAPKLTEANLFGLDPAETSYLQHGNKTVIGLLHDNIECASPSHEVDVQQIAKMRAATERLVVLPRQPEKVVATACVKVDIANDPRVLRNLDVEIVEIGPRVVCAFPGKMTEAPFLADVVLRRVLEATNGATAHLRPLDVPGLFAPRARRPTGRADVQPVV